MAMAEKIKAQMHDRGDMPDESSRHFQQSPVALIVGSVSTGFEQEWRGMASLK